MGFVREEPDHRGSWRGLPVTSAPRHTLRIIGGRWRSRTLSFPDRPGLRPTPNRVRETLFNWLRDDLDGARCLDLFAGSGALGFEAASRGAARVVQVESDGAAVAALAGNGRMLRADTVEYIQADVGQFLAGPSERFDLVFLDPPFRQHLAGLTCQALDVGEWLTPRAKIYVEAEREGTPAGIPGHWRLLRNGSAGEVAYYLYERSEPTP